MSHLSVFRTFWAPFFFKQKKAVFNGEQEKESIIHVRMGSKSPASLVTPNRDPQDGFFDPTLTIMMDSYIVI